MLQKGANLAPKGELEKGVCRLYNKSMTSIKLSENGGKAPEAVPYMPAGLNEICCTVNGRAGKRTVMVDAAACERLEADLQEQIKAHQAGGRARPVILFDHKAGAAAAVPTGFEWDEKRGILLRVEWTQAGRAAVEGGNYAYISPAFKLAPQSESITGLQDGVEVGSLVNDPAFTRNECIAAAREVVEDVQVYAANPYGCNQYGHEFKAPHGEGWGGGGQQEDTLDSIKKRKLDIGSKQQETANELVKLAKQSEAEKDLEKRKKINAKIAEASQKKQKLMEQYRKLAMKETELKDRERQEKAENAEVAERYNKVKPRAERVLKEYEEANSLWTGAELGSRARKVNRLRLIREIWGHMDSAKNRVKRIMDGKEGLSEKEETDLNEELDILEKETKRAKKWANIINRQYEAEELKASFAELEKELEDEFILAANLAPFCDVEKSAEEGDNIRAANNGSERTTEENSDMETVKKQLGLGADATPAEVAAAIAALKKKSEAGQKRIEEVEAECNEHKKALQEHKERAADGFIERLRKGGKVAHKDEETLKAAREMYMENPERTERIYAAMQPICPPEEGEGERVQANRVPSGDAAKMSVADFYANMDF